ncbi:hypothetical protein RBU61_04330 [Tissierella sp. MB52-C2]|uniref:hypothetical protein n=1 Tax=Tissierella sp. MB52-C2 TaxID=3070999 RepID=UPI00280C2DF0|nr:hypothetical protein [Tissierella sp. MB52-C2]WMM25906.1 hypothetical protein RBU61_04330 [Tissierella sp. MB52-C2]
MRYQLKSIFRNRITLTVLVIIIILNLYTVINLEREAYSSKSKIVDNLELELIQAKEANARNKDSVKARYKDPEILSLHDNYTKLREWLIKNKERMIEIYKNLNPEEYSDELLAMEIMEIRTVMDVNADFEENRPLSEDIFKEEITMLGLKEELPVDFNKIINNAFYTFNIKEDRHAIYDGLKSIITRLLDLYKTKEKRLELDIASPWTFYVRKVGFEGFSVPVLCTIFLVYTCAMVVEDRKSRSMQLVKVLPKNRGYIFGHYYTAILLSVFIILIISFLIPILFMGIRHGFGGLRNLILVDPKGFTSFNGYEHVDIWGTLGIGRFATSSMNMNHGAMPSNQLELYPLWKVMGLSMIPAILKLLFLTLLGVGIGLCISNKNTSILVTSLVAVIYIVFQLYGSDMLFNPLSIGSAWNITLGGMAFTWVRAVVVLVVALIASTTIIYIIINKQDFNV